MVDAKTLSVLNDLGYILVSRFPPIWVFDGDLKNLGLSNAKENLNFKTINNPGAYIGQKKSKINIDKDCKLNQHFKQIFNSETFIDNKSSNLYLKVYDKKSRLDENRYLDRLHIDRSRNKDNLRSPMKFTTIICHNDSGSINFPFGICENKTCDKVDYNSYNLDQHSITDKNKDGWKIIENKGCGLKISSKPGRIILFVSCDNNNIPLYRSLHQGVDDVNNNEPRMITVIGWDGKHWETGGYHECIEHESFEMRADFFNRTIEEELVGVSQTIGPRRGEALMHLNQLAINRNTTIENLIREVENNSNTNSVISRFSNQSKPSKEKIPEKIYTEEANCPVCFGDFMKTSQDRNSEILIEPGHLSCGHVICETCYNDMRRHSELVNHKNEVKCMSCRKYSTYWKSLFDLESSA